MKSGVMKTVSVIYTIFGVIGSYNIAFGNEDLYDFFGVSSIAVFISCLVITALMSCVLFAISTLIENSEYNESVLVKIRDLQKQVIEMQNNIIKLQNSARLTDVMTEEVVNSSSTTSTVKQSINSEIKTESNTWKCPECGKTLSNEDMTCYFCGHKK